MVSSDHYKEGIWTLLNHTTKNPVRRLDDIVADVRMVKQITDYDEYVSLMLKLIDEVSELHRLTVAASREWNPNLELASKVGITDKVN